MTIHSADMPELRKATIELPDTWVITYHNLYYLSPENSAVIATNISGVSVWDLIFIEDLLQIENVELGLLLDVGWYPHADPSGKYRLIVVQLRNNDQHGNCTSAYDWQNPIIEYDTRSIDDLIEKIHGIPGIIPNQK